MTPQANSKLQLLRAKQQQGQQLTQEDLREAVQLMREARGQAAVTSAKSKTAKAPIDSGKLLDELDGL